MISNAEEPAPVADAWTLYWQADHLESCIASRDPADRQFVAGIWQAFADSLPSAATVLDLATGNGFVPAQLAARRPDLEVTAVDLADIRPRAFVSHPALADIEFRGGVDVAALPFADESFDAVTSQFGIEYADATAADEAVRVLRPGGRVLVLAHHVDSEVLRPVAARRAEAEALLAPDGVVTVLAAHTRGTATGDELERAGRRHIDSALPKSRQLSGQVFEAVNVILERLAADPQQAAQLSDNVARRVAAEAERLAQLQRAALSGDAVESLAARFRAAGLADCHYAAVKLPGEGGALLGWQLAGTRSAGQRG